MSRHALVDASGLVINLVEYEGHDITLPDGHTLVETDAFEAQIGGHYDGTTFTPPALAVPKEVTRLQGRLALNGAGLLQQVEAAVAQAGGATAIWYQDAQNWRRDDPYIANLAAALGLSSATVDGLFVTAGGL